VASRQSAHEVALTLLKATFFNLVCGKCKWDYKWDLNDKFGDGKRFWVAVRDDPAPEVFRSDLFGNIFYAYVGRAVGISEPELYWGAEVFGGKNSESDRDAIRLGWRLWNDYGMRVTADRLRYAIRDNMWQFQNNLDDNGVRKPLQPILKP
jgi:hypothetical protein